jgi:hypothetical protein
MSIRPFGEPQLPAHSALNMREIGFKEALEDFVLKNQLMDTLFPPVEWKKKERFAALLELAPHPESQLELMHQYPDCVSELWFQKFYPHLDSMGIQQEYIKEFGHCVSEETLRECIGDMWMCLERAPQLISRQMFEKIMSEYIDGWDASNPDEFHFWEDKIKSLLKVLPWHLDEDLMHTVWKKGLFTVKELLDYFIGITVTKSEYLIAFLEDGFLDDFFDYDTQAGWEHYVDEYSGVHQVYRLLSEPLKNSMIAFKEKELPELEKVGELNDSDKKEALIRYLKEQADLSSRLCFVD